MRYDGMPAGTGSAVSLYGTLVAVLAGVLLVLGIAQLVTGLVWELRSFDFVFIVLYVAQSIAALVALTRVDTRDRVFAVLVATSTTTLLAGLLFYDGFVSLWAALLVPATVLALSPLRRYLVPYVVAVSAGLVAVAVSEWVLGYPEWMYDPWRIASIVIIFAGIGIMARTVTDDFWRRFLEARRTNDRIVTASEQASASVREIAHQLQEPLDEIVAAAEDVERDPGPRRRLETITAESDDVAASIDRLLEANRVRAGLVEIDAESVAVAALLKARFGADVACDPDLAVEADPALLERALRHTEEAFACDGLWMARQSGEMIEISFRAKHGHDRIVDNVALEIARGLVEAHGGWLLVENGEAAIGLPVSVPEGDVQDPNEAGLTAVWPHVVPFMVVVLVVMGLGIGRAWSGNVWLYVAVAATFPVFNGLSFFGNGLLHGVAVAGESLAVLGLIWATDGESPAWALMILTMTHAILLPIAVRFVFAVAAGAGVFVTIAFSGPPWMAQDWGIYVAALVPLVTTLLLAPVGDALARLECTWTELNSQLLETRREAATFLAVIAHELRTPLTSVRGYAESLLLDNAWDHTTRREFAGAIGSEARRLVDIVTELDRRADTGATLLTIDTCPVNLDVVADSAVAGFADARPDRDIRLEAEPVVVDADAGRVREVIDNLLENAVRYSGALGRIDVTVGKQASSAVVEVADNGPGLPAGTADRAFDRFWRAPGAPGHGTGLGLAIAKEIIDLHGEGSEIWVRETPGGGATFGFALPLAERAADRRASPVGPRMGVG